MGPEAGRPESPGEQAAVISREMVRLLRKYAGRGPTKARTTIGRDHVLVVLHDTLTTAERTVVENGDRQLILRTREALQAAMKSEATGMVSGLTGREVVAFMSTNHMDPDCAAEIFLLAPEADSEAAALGPHEADAEIETVG